MDESLQEIINRLWNTPEHAEWTRKTDVIPLADIQRWIASTDIEILGLTYSLVTNKRFRIEPPISLSEYVEFIKHYYERCLRENPGGVWSDSSYSAGMDFVNLFATLWRDSSVPRPMLEDLKSWLGHLYKQGDPELRTCIVQASLEHLFEQKEIRKFFSDWRKDEVLAEAHREASEWYKGGGHSPLGKPPSVSD
jgi:hypothetical protein